MIFISYSLKDEAPFTSLCLALESANLPYWKGRLKSGASLKEQLREAISKCEVCIFIATRSSVTSQWCLNEIGAFWGAGKRIILYAANPDIENKFPPLFKGDYWTCNAREVIRQVKEEFEELAAKATLMADTGAATKLDLSPDNAGPDSIKLRQALASLRAFNQNLPEDDIEEKYVTHYHLMLDEVQTATGYDFIPFRIPQSELRRRQELSGYDPRSGFRTSPSQERYCDRAVFLIGLRGAMNFIDSFLPH